MGRPTKADIAMLKWAGDIACEKQMYTEAWERAQKLSLRFGGGDMGITQEMVMYAFEEARKLKARIDANEQRMRDYTVEKLDLECWVALIDAEALMHEIPLNEGKVREALRKVRAIRARIEKIKPTATKPFYVQRHDLELQRTEEDHE